MSKLEEIIEQAVVETCYGSRMDACRRAVREALEMAAQIALEPGVPMDAEQRSIYIAEAIRHLAVELGDK